MGGLIQSVEVVNLDYDIVDYCKQVASIAEFDLVTVFGRNILVVDQLVLENVDKPDLIGERDDEVKARRMEGKAQGFLFVMFYHFEVVLLKVVPDSDGSVA